MKTTTIDKAAYITKVDEALNNIRPFLEKDGGNIEVVDVSENLDVTVRLLGNCTVCPMSASTMKAGVEETIKKHIPEINSVTAVE